MADPTTTTVTIGVTSAEKTPAAPPAALAGADAILSALASLSGDVRALGESIETNKREADARFEGMAETIGQVVEYVNGSLPPPTAPSDGSPTIAIEPLRVTVPRAAQVAADAKKGVELLTLQMAEVKAELQGHSSLMGIGKRGLAWAISAEGRKQLGLLALAVVGVMHTLGWVK